MTAFTAHWDCVVVLRPVLKHNHTHIHPPNHDMTENTPLILSQLHLKPSHFTPLQLHMEEGGLLHEKMNDKRANYLQASLAYFFDNKTQPLLPFNQYRPSHSIKKLNNTKKK